MFDSLLLSAFISSLFILEVFLESDAFTFCALSLRCLSAESGVLSLPACVVFISLPLPAFVFLAKLGAIPVTTSMILSIHTHALYAIPVAPAFFLFNSEFFITSLLTTLSINLLLAKYNIYDNIMKCG